jgi:hypothetical protein
VLEEGVVDSAADVDFGMIMGTGWAPFRGGPLRYADSVGSAPIVRRLAELARDVAPHFAPCRRLREMARQSRPFHPAPVPVAATEGGPADPGLAAARHAPPGDRPVASPEDGAPGERPPPDAPPASAPGRRAESVK